MKVKHGKNEEEYYINETVNKEIKKYIERKNGVTYM